VRVSGTQTWIGRSPRARNRLRWARTLSRDDKRFGAERRFERDVIGDPGVVTCNLPEDAAKCNTTGNALFGPCEWTLVHHVPIRGR